MDDLCVPVLLLSIACCALVGVLITQRSMAGGVIMSSVFEHIDGRLGTLENRLLSLHANLDLQNQLAASRADEEAENRAHIQNLQRTLSVILMKMHAEIPQQAVEEEDPGVIVVEDDDA